MDYDDEESSLVIAEGDDDDEALGNQAIDLSSTRGKRKRRKMGRGNQSDFFLTSDSENEFSHYLTNGDDCEGALDLSMGKNSKSASSSSSLAEKISVQKGQLLDGLGLKPTSKSLVVVQVKPESITGLHPPNSSMGLINCNNMTKSNIYMSAKGKRYRDMRRSRTIIQAEQLDILYGCYFKDPNPGKHEFEQIAEWVHLPKKVVQIWFQNMRARERKGEVRFISDGTLAAVGKPLIKFTWPLTKPIFSHKPSTNNAGGTAAPLMVRTLLKTEMETVKESSKPTMVKKLTPIPIKPKEVHGTVANITILSHHRFSPKPKILHIQKRDLTT
uniref:Homeobox domain-containing protein n=1 Tax=Gouania willdenowi TaxID=441366 RepID=A0A8C5GXT8_GOUWI